MGFKKFYCPLQQNCPILNYTEVGGGKENHMISRNDSDEYKCSIVQTNNQECIYLNNFNLTLAIAKKLGIEGKID